MPIMKITTRWDGWTGAPGYSNWYVWGSPDQTQTDAAAAAVRTFLQAIRAYLPSVVSINFVPTVQVYAEGDGSLADQRNIVTIPGTVTGSGAGNFAASTGIVVSWRTTQSTGRRLLLGRTFLVPASAVAYQTDGTVDNGALVVIAGAANAYVARVAADVPGHPVVWHRPVNGGGGSMGNITAATVADRTAVLRSRRD